MISHKYWRSRFASDPNVAGRNVQINNVPVTIVGVIEPAFTGVQRAIPGADPPEVSVPLALDDRLSTNNAPGGSRLSQATAWWLQVMGRVKPGVTALQVQGNLEGMFQPAARAGLDSYLTSLPEAQRSTSRNRNRTNVPVLRVDAGNRGVYDVGDNEVRAVAILSAVVALVLLIVCANVANLLLARATSRQQGNLGAALDGRDARAAHPPAAHRERAARVTRRCAGRPDGLLGTAASAGSRKCAAGSARTDAANRLARPVVRARSHGADGDRVRSRTRRARHPRRRGRHAQREQP